MSTISTQCQLELIKPRNTCVKQVCNLLCSLQARYFCLKNGLLNNRIQNWPVVATSLRCVFGTRNGTKGNGNRNAGHWPTAVLSTTNIDGCTKRKKRKRDKKIAIYSWAFSHRTLNQHVTL